MPEQGQTTTTSSEGSAIRFNPLYFKQPPGILKIIQLVLGILCLILASPAYLSGTGFFLFAVVICFLSSLVWIFIYLLSIHEALQQLPINWLLTELVNTGIQAVVLLIGVISHFISVVGYSGTSFFGSYVAAGELINTCILTAALGLGSLVQLIEWIVWGTTYYGFGANIAGGVFGLLNSLVYAAGAYLLYQQHRQP